MMRCTDHSSFVYKPKRPSITGINHALGVSFTTNNDTTHNRHTVCYLFCNERMKGFKPRPLSVLQGASGNALIGR
ncbi:MAG: hypothetical protein R3220_08615, partial [Balneolaceae bacterium]|nr:hypothetical protein [Balneolaceae bacterium]